MSYRIKKYVFRGRTESVAIVKQAFWRVNPSRVRGNFFNLSSSHLECPFSASLSKKQSD